MSSCHTFRPVPGQCGPRGRGPLPAPPFDPQDYWATRKLVSSLFGTLETSKLDRADVVDPSAATEDGKAADAKRTQEELDRILGVASGALSLAESKADKLSSRQLEAVNSGIDADKVAKIAQNETAISAEVSRATTEEARLQALINAIKTFDAVVADSLPVPSEQYSKKLYLVPSTNPETQNVKDEFICVKIGDSWSWEQVGSTAITIEFDDEPTEGSQKAARSGGIWSWVKSLLPKWLTSNYAEPATVESVAKKADKTIPSKRGNLSALAEDGNLIDSYIDMQDLALKNQVNWMADSDSGFVSGYGDGLRFEIGDGEQRLAVLKGRVIVDRDGKDAGERSVAMLGDINSATRGKADKAPNSTSGHLASLTEHGDLGDSGLDRLDIARMYGNSLVVQPGGMTTRVDASMLGYSIDSGDTLKVRVDAKADRTSLAPEYSATSAYSVGAIVYHDGSIYQCKAAIADGGEAWNAEHWELRKLDDFFTESNSLLAGTIDARLPYPLNAVTDETGLLKDRSINTTSLASVTVPDNFTDLLVRASVASSLSVTMPEAIATKYGDTFPGEAGEYLITITKTGAAEAYVRTIKLEEVA